MAKHKQDKNTSTSEVTPVNISDQIPKMQGLIKAEDRKKISGEIQEILRAINQDRQEWLARKIDFLANWNEYVYPIRKGPWDGSSNLHLPLTMEKIKALHARMIQSFFGIKPWFVIKPREKLDIKTVELKDQFMQCCLTNYVNHYEGIFDVFDSWLWSVIADGWKILKLRWERQQRKAVTVEVTWDPATEEYVEQEKKGLQTIFDGPVVEELRQEDCYMMADYPDIQKAPFFCPSYMDDPL